VLSQNAIKPVHHLDYPQTLLKGIS